MFNTLYVPENTTCEEAAKLRISEIAAELASLNSTFEDAISDVKFFALRMTECETSPSRREMKGWAFESFTELMNVAERAAVLYTEKESLYRAFIDVDIDEELLAGIPEEELRAVVEELYY